MLCEERTVGLHAQLVEHKLLYEPAALARVVHARRAGDDRVHVDPGQAQLHRRVLLIFPEPQRADLSRPPAQLLEHDPSLLAGDR